jgi:hypothetical protein
VSVCVKVPAACGTSGREGNAESSLDRKTERKKLLRISRRTLEEFIETGVGELEMACCCVHGNNQLHKCEEFLDQLRNC